VGKYTKYLKKLKILVVFYLSIHIITRIISSY